MPRVGSVYFFRKDHFSNIFRTGKVYKKQRLFSEAVAQRCSVEMHYKMSREFAVLPGICKDRKKDNLLFNINSNQLA